MGPVGDGKDPLYTAGPSPLVEKAGPLLDRDG